MITQEYEQLLAIETIPKLRKQILCSYSFTAEHFGGASLDCRNQDELFQKKLQS
jgi:hypothetical protein